MAVHVRLRTSADLPALLAALVAQQLSSGYPVQWPLRAPVEAFLVRPGEVRAWIAEDNGTVHGHVAVQVPGNDDTGRAYRTASGRDDVMEVTVLFTSIQARGRGIGGLLLDTAAGWIREQGALPVLEVLANLGTAIDVYRHRGWVEIGRISPAWLPTHIPLHDRVILLMMLPDTTEGGPAALNPEVVP